MLVWDSRLWHGTFANTSKVSRWAMVATFGSWWIKPMMDMPKSLQIQFIENVIIHKNKC